MRVAIYTRVSTTEQSIRQQLETLRTWAKGRRYSIAAEFNDEGVSGVSDRRRALNELRDRAKRGEFDIVAAVALDRLGRSLQHVVALLDEFRQLGVDVYLHRENVDTSTASGKALLGMSMVFAEFERAILIERVQAGIERARVHGTRSGKPIGRPPLDDETKATVRALVEEGIPKVRIAQDLGISRTSVYRALQEE